MGGILTPLMNSFIAENKLSQIAEKHTAAYQAANPFPHIVIDNFLDENALSEVLDVFPSPEEQAFYKYDNPLAKIWPWTSFLGCRLVLPSFSSF